MTDKRRYSSQNVWQATGDGYVILDGIIHLSGFEVTERLNELARLRALEEAVVLLYDDIGDHLPDDVLKLVSESRARLASLEAGVQSDG